MPNLIDSVKFKNKKIFFFLVHEYEIDIRSRELLGKEY